MAATKPERPRVPKKTVPIAATPIALASCWTAADPVHTPYLFPIYVPNNVRWMITNTVLYCWHAYVK